MSEIKFTEKFCLAQALKQRHMDYKYKLSTFERMYGMKKVLYKYGIIIMYYFLDLMLSLLS